jgi:hypothetical protein
VNVNKELKLIPLKRLGRRKSRGQSIVEFTLLLPLLLMLLSSLIEFGFALNEYLDLIDTTRETARYLADQMPFLNEETKTMREAFYLEGVVEMENTIQRAGWIELDPATDDLVISVFGITDYTNAVRYPDSFTDSRGECSSGVNGGEDGWRRYCRATSKFTSADVINRISGLANAPPNNGVVLVEIFYVYHMKLGLPWVTEIVGDTLTLHAFSFAPNPAAEPDS